MIARPILNWVSCSLDDSTDLISGVISMSWNGLTIQSTQGELSVDAANQQIPFGYDNVVSPSYVSRSFEGFDTHEFYFQFAEWMQNGVDSPHYFMINGFAYCVRMSGDSPEFCIAGTEFSDDNLSPVQYPYRTIDGNIVVANIPTFNGPARVNPWEEFADEPPVVVDEDWFDYIEICFEI